MSIERKDHRYEFELEELVKILKLKGKLISCSVDKVIFAEAPTGQSCDFVVTNCECGEVHKRKRVVIQTKEEIELE